MATSNSYGAGGWGSDDDDVVMAPPPTAHRPRGRVDEGRRGGGSSRGGEGARPQPSSSRSYLSSSRSDPSRDNREAGSRNEMEQYRQQHIQRRFQRRVSPAPPPPSSLISSEHLPSTTASSSSSSHRRRSRSPPRSRIHAEPNPNHQRPRHKPSSRRRREQSPSDSPPPSNPPPNSSFKSSSNAIASSSRNYHPEDRSPPPRSLSRTTSASSNQTNRTFSRPQRQTLSPVSISSHSQTVSPPSTTAYSPIFHCETDATLAPPSRKASSSSRPDVGGSSSSRPLLPPPQAKIAESAPLKKKKKLLSEIEDADEEETPPPQPWKPYDDEDDEEEYDYGLDGFEEVDEIDATKSETEVVDLQGKPARMQVDPEDEDSGPDLDSEYDDEVQEIQPRSATSKAAAPPPPPRQPPPPPPQHSRATSSSSAFSNSIPAAARSTSPNPHDVKSASASSKLEPAPPRFPPPLDFQNAKQNPFARSFQDPQNGPILPRHWVPQPPPPRQSFGGPKNAQQLAAYTSSGGMGGKAPQQQFAQPIGWGMQPMGGVGMMMPPGFVPQQHQLFPPSFPDQHQPFFPPPSLGNRTPSYGSHGNQTPRGAGAGFGAGRIEWIELDAHGVPVNGCGGSVSPQGSGGGSVRVPNGGGGSLSPPQDGGVGNHQFNPQPRRPRSSSDEFKLTYRSIDSYPRLSATKELEYKERKARCIELAELRPGPDKRRALEVNELEKVDWYLKTINFALLNKIDVDDDPFINCEKSMNFFKSLMSEPEYNGLKAARKEVNFLLELREKRNNIPLGMPPREEKKVKALLEEIRPRLALLEDLISLRHPVFKAPPPIKRGTLLFGEWKAAEEKAKKKEEERARAKAGKGKGKARATE